MSAGDGTLQIVVSLASSKGRNGRQRRNGAETKSPEPPRIPRIARLMALAVKFQDMVDHGEVRDLADLARLGYVSRARLTQIMNLLLLAPEIQEEILGMHGQAIKNNRLSERRLRAVAKIVLWDDQRHEG